MTYFADLTPYAYSLPTPLLVMPVLNIGWLGEGHPFSSGPTPPEFRQRLLTFCRDEHVLYLCRGFHVCELCVATADDPYPGLMPQLGEAWSFIGNGQIRVLGDGVVYAAPTMIIHYVQDHAYQPPIEFVTAVLAGDPDSAEHRALRTTLQGSPTNSLYRLR